MKLKEKIRKDLSIVLSAAMVAGLMHVAGVPVYVEAGNEMPYVNNAEIRNINLNMENRIAGIGDPDTWTPDKDSWSGSTVYFGYYGDLLEPVKYRVLDAVTTDYSKDGSTETMLLDCDSILSNKAFDSASPVKEWPDSDINKWLNDDAGGFLKEAFEYCERDAVCESENSSHGNWDTVQDGIGYTGLNGEKVFLLDAREAVHKEYGYGYEKENGDGRVVNFKDGEFWLRSANALMVNGDGSIMEGSGEKGVSPALNVNLSNILYTSSASEDNTAGFQKTEEKDKYEPWKLTLSTGEQVELEVNTTFNSSINNLNVIPGDVNRNSISFTVKANLSSTYARYSAMLVDKNGTVEAYGPIYSGQITGNQSKSLSVEFPDNISEGEYSLKIFAESDAGQSDAGICYTNYATEMASLHVRVGRRTADEISYGPSVLCNTDLPDWDNDGCTEWNYVDGMRVSFGFYKYGAGWIDPMLWHVLKSDGKSEAFLDGEYAAVPNPEYQDYEEVNQWLNGEFLKNFNSIERERIKEKELEKDEYKMEIAGKADEVALKDDPLSCRVFCLSAREVYGYYKNPNNSSNIMTGNKFTSNHISETYPFHLPKDTTSYLLRSWYEDADGKHMCGAATGSGYGGQLQENNQNTVVIPALYMDLSDVLFVSDSSFDKTADYKTYEKIKSQNTEGKIYKFTLRDNDMELYEDTDAGKKVTMTEEDNKNTLHIPLKYEDASPEEGNDIIGKEEFQISVLIKNTAIEHYAKAVSEIPANGIVDIELPDGFNGESIYLVAEKVHTKSDAYNQMLTDYASNVLEIKVPQMIKEVKVDEFDNPEAFKALDKKGRCDTGGVAEKMPEAEYEKYEDGGVVSVTQKEEEKAGFDTTYRINFTLSAEEGYCFSNQLKAENVTVNGQPADSIVINKDGTLTVYYTFEPTLKPKLISVEQPQDITVSNGTPKTKEDLGLPDWADINIESGESCQVQVTWDLENLADGTSYDPELLTEQRFTVNGTFILPDTVINPDNIATAVKVNVIAQAADVTGIPYADPPSGKYSEELNVKLFSSTEGADIYYTLDGSVPDKENGIKYTQAIPVTGKPGETVKTVIKAVAYKDKMQGSGVAEFEYEVSVPLPTYRLTVINGLGSGEYEAGTVVAITANDAPAGKKFKEWIVISKNVSIQAATDMSAAFVMPNEAVEVEAVYEDIPPEEYTVTVIDDGNGKANANVAQAAAGNKIILSYNANTGYHFKEWQILAGNVTIEDNGFIMPDGNVTVKAVFEKDEEPSSEEPSSEEPSSEEPSSEEPSSEEPSSEEPSSEEPSSEEPSSEEPSSEEPSSEEPSSEEPSSEEPSTEEPTTKEPTTKEPTTKEPATKEPTTKETTARPQETTREMQTGNTDNNKTVPAQTESGGNHKDSSNPAQTGDDVPVTWMFILIISGAGSIWFGRNKASSRKKQ